MELVFITIALFWATRVWIHLLKRLWRASNILGVVGAIDCPISASHGPEVERGWIALLLVITVVDISVTHAVFAIIGAPHWVVIRLNLTPALQFFSWPWIATELCD